MAGAASEIETAGTEGLTSTTAHGHGAGVGGDSKEAVCVVARNSISRSYKREAAADAPAQSKIQRLPKARKTKVGTSPACHCLTHHNEHDADGNDRKCVGRDAQHQCPAHCGEKKKMTSSVPMFQLWRNRLSIPGDTSSVSPAMECVVCVLCCLHMKFGHGDDE